MHYLIVIFSVRCFLKVVMKCCFNLDTRYKLIHESFDQLKRFNYLHENVKGGSRFIFLQKCHLQHKEGPIRSILDHYYFGYSILILNFEFGVYSLGTG